MITLNNAQVTFNTTNKSYDKDTTISDTTPLIFDLNIVKGEKIAIIGKSGAGKSTLLNVIAGFVFVDNIKNQKKANGAVILGGAEHTNTKPYQRPVSMLFQHNNLFNHLTVADNIGLGLKPNLKLTDDDKQQIKNVAHQVGLADMLKRKPSQLSGGQQQRVALARCLLRDKPILLLDEPFSALDKALRLGMLNLLTQLANEKQLTLLIITHQPEELTGFVDKVLEINAGTIREVLI